MPTLETGPITTSGRVFHKTPFVVALAVALVTVAPVYSRAAMTNYVTNLEDSGPGSLRQAIGDSNSGDLVKFRTNGIIRLTSGEIYITNSINLNGPGATNLLISGNNTSRVFNISATVTGSISGLTIRDGRTADGITNLFVSGNGGDGGGLYNAGAITISRCVFTANRTGNGGNGILGPGNSGGAGGSGGSGGALYNRGTLILNDCVLSNNVSGFGGSGASGTSTNGTGGIGGSGGAGGGVCNFGTLVVTSCLFSGNSTGSGGVGGNRGSGAGGAGGGGGAIWNQQGTVTITACTLSGNSCGDGNYGGGGGNGYGAFRAGNGGAGGSGGGVGNQRGVAITSASTINGNAGGKGGDGGLVSFTPGAGAGGSGGSGAGIWNDEGTMTAIACTISSNLCRVGGRGGYGGNGAPGGVGGSGAGIGNQRGILTVTACTLTWNSCGNGGKNEVCYECGLDSSTAPGGSGGGIAAPFSSNAFVVLQNVLIAQNSSGKGIVCCYSTNSAPGPDVFGAFTSHGYNLIGAGNGSTGLLNGTNGDRVGTTNAPINPSLGPLQDNGGPTFTHALLAGSPAIDAGTNCGLAFDQRGQPRTIDNPAVPNATGGDGTDIGALEVNHVLTATEVRKAGNDILVRFTSVSDKTYGVEYKSEINGAAWISLPGTVTGTGGIVTYTDAGAAVLPSRFYRLFEQLP